MFAVLLSVSLQSRSDRPPSAAGKFTSARQSCSNFGSTSPAGEGRAAGRDEQLTDTPAEPIGRGYVPLRPGAGPNPGPPVSAFNNNSLNSNKEHLLRPATSHTKLPRPSDGNYRNTQLCLPLIQLFYACTIFRSGLISLRMIYRDKLQKNHSKSIL